MERDAFWEDPSIIGRYAFSENDDVKIIKKEASSRAKPLLTLNNGIRVRSSIHI